MGLGCSLNVVRTVAATAPPLLALALLRTTHVVLQCPHQLFRAGALLLAVFFVAAAFGDAINAVLEVHWGRLINLPYLFMTVWNRLFRADTTFEISEASAWLMLVLICAACLALLNRKLRAFEVVK